jgi:hypothetical protein
MLYLLSPHGISGVAVFGRLVLGKDDPGYKYSSISS